MRSPSTGMVGASLSAVLAIAARERQPDGNRQVEGLRMTQDYSHRPVMLDEVVAAFAPVPDGLFVDATVGGGGHTAALLDAHPGWRALGIDRDPAALEAAGRALARVGDRARLVRARFDAIAGLVGPEEHVVGVLFDLGVSSPQLDQPGRGFSYRGAGPLDMRMGPDGELTAATVVNTYPADRLAALFRANGEQRFGMRIARAIVAARPIGDTAELAEVVRAAIPAPARRHGGHPARRVFQAIRIEVNDELRILGGAIDAAIDLLEPSGRIAVLAALRLGVHASALRRSMTRSRALSARWLAATSSALGPREPRNTRRCVATAPHMHGMPGGQVHPPDAAVASAAFAIRSSPLW